MTVTAAPRPLDGLVVLDFSQIVAGPLAAMVLGDLGARVIKIEPPSGDAARQLGSRAAEGYQGMFESFNRGKESIVLDLRTSQDREQALTLVENADVLIESSRVGVMDRLGLGVEAVRQRNPGLIYVSINAFGETGPNADRGGVDVVVQAETGWMSITGEPDGPPTKLGSIPIDAATGHVAAQGALAALFARTRTGRGDVVRVSLYDVACSLHTHDFTDYLSRGWVAKRSGNYPAATTPSGVYATADGSIVLAAYMPHHWQSAVEILDDDRLRSDPRFATMKDRIRHRDELLSILKEVLRRRTTAEWSEAFESARITSGVVRDTGEVAESDQFAAAGLAVELTGRDGEPVRTIRSPARYGSFGWRPATAAPALDANRAAVDRDFGRDLPAAAPAR
ncbi:CaiB/BaiF CoA transferase family protein [Mycobacterium sp.]|uniref:CaiB/BaiF CoA transferase family protein n=1 Tax=Mycobacterium sp. TaxID=1785 RepID=UPI003BB146C6